MSHSPTAVPFEFPARTPHSGIPLGNGTFGALIWGGEPADCVHVTINRQDYWQHAGEICWQPGATHAAVSSAVLARQASRAIPEFIDFQHPDMPAPTRMPAGRFDLMLPAPVTAAQLDLATGTAQIDTEQGRLSLVMLRGRAMLAIRGAVQRIIPVPNNSPEVAEYRRRYGMEEPVRFQGGGVSGWYQVGLDGQALCTASRRAGDTIWLTCQLAHSVEEARGRVFHLLHDDEISYTDAYTQSAEFYAKWWRDSAWIEVEHRPTQAMFDLGLFKLAGLTQPGGPAPTLQGPWVEDDRMPPWGSDYHFNVNFQMCHWPMLPTNHLALFEPAMRMLTAWMPKMQAYARTFTGISDGLMLPHAVDDRCVPANLSWRCQFDPGSAGWTALLFWDLYRYGGDRAVLRDFTYPLLRGALRVYEALLEPRGSQMVLKLTPSPEFFPAQEGLPGYDWGENTSFQLAVLHGLLRAALAAAEILQIEEPRSSAWKQLQTRVPRASVHYGRIFLFDGQDLVASHRHHSHLAGLYPFDVLDADGADQALVQNSLTHWVKTGSGAWTGWCLPWAAILWARVDQAEAAGAALAQYRRFFTGPNGASRHDAVADGFTIFRKNPHIMQIDAAMGAVAAVCEMLAHERHGQVRLAPAVPQEWGDTAFGGLRLPGGRFAGGERAGGVWRSLTASDPTFDVTMKSGGNSAGGLM